MWNNLTRDAIIMAPTKPPAAKAPPAAEAAAKPAPKPKAAPTPRKTAAASAPPATPPQPSAAAKPAAAPARPAAPRARPVVTPGTGNVVKLKDLLQQVVKATGSKKKAVKDTVTATLEALGAALSRGDGFNLPSLGKAQVNRQRTLAEGEMIIVKLRRHDPKPNGKKPVAEPLAKPGKER